MKLGVMASGIAALGWERALAYCKELGLDAIDIPCGARPHPFVLHVEAASRGPAAQQSSKARVHRHGLVISATACHGNPVHPDPDEAKKHERAHDVCVRLAPKLGVNVVNQFSGCPG